MVQPEVLVCEILLNETLALKIIENLRSMYCSDMFKNK